MSRTGGQGLIDWVQSWDEYKNEFVREVHINPTGPGTYTMTVVTRDLTPEEIAKRDGAWP